MSDCIDTYVDQYFSSLYLEHVALLSFQKYMLHQSSQLEARQNVNNERHKHVR